MWLFQLCIIADFSQHIPLNDFAAYVGDMMRRDKLEEQYEVCIFTKLSNRTHIF